MERMQCGAINLKHNILVYSTDMLTESLITGQTYTLGGIYRDAISHGLLENTIYKLCYKAGPPSERGRQQSQSAPFTEKAYTK